MRFLCERHRHWLSQNPGELLPGWLRTLIEGRAAAAERNFEKAILYFGNALDMADIMMSHAATLDAQQRYIDTATELMQALTLGRDSAVCERLFGAVLSRLEREKARNFLPESLRALRDMALGQAPVVTTAVPRAADVSPYLH